MKPLTIEIAKDISSVLKKLSIYIHIPFCKKKCDYCDFYSEMLNNNPAVNTALKKNENNKTIEKKTIDNIINQYNYFIQKYHNIKTISIGGGTPSILQRNLLQSLLANINSKIGKPDKKLSIPGETVNNEAVLEKPGLLEEFTIEANPESIDKDFIDICRDNGITRISLGVQSFHDSLLARLGRITNNKHNIQALELINKLGNIDLNIDLMAGIPGQNKDMLKADLKTALAYNPSHISLYALTIENETKLHKLLNEKKIIPLEGYIQEELWLTGARLLKKHGYINYEISNFAKPGKKCMHNLNYWKMNPYLGIGPGAVSTLPIKHNKIIRLYNTRDIRIFLNGDIENIWNQNYEYISGKEFLLENLIMGFRLKKGLNKKHFLKRFGKNFNDFFPETYTHWKKTGDLIETNNRIALNTKSRYYLNQYLLAIYNEFEKIDNNEIKINWPD